MAEFDDKRAFSFVPSGPHDNDLDISSAVDLSALAPTGAAKLLMQALTQSVRYTLDGTTPTASKGFQLKAGDPPIVLPLSEGMTVSVIEETATAALQYQFGAG